MTFHWMRNDHSGKIVPIESVVDHAGGWVTLAIGARDAPSMMAPAEAKALAAALVHYAERAQEIMDQEDIVRITQQLLNKLAAAKQKAQP